MKLMRTLDPGVIVSPKDFARMPNKTGIVQISIVSSAAQIVAFVTVFGDFVARQR